MTLKGLKKSCLARCDRYVTDPWTWRFCKVDRKCQSKSNKHCSIQLTPTVRSSCKRTRQSNGTRVEQRERASEGCKEEEEETSLLRDSRGSRVAANNTVTKRYKRAFRADGWARGSHASPPHISPGPGVLQSAKVLTFIGPEWSGG